MSPGRIDHDVIRRHLFALDETLNHLRRHQSKTKAQLAGDRDTLWSVERGLLLCVQNALDIATHLAASAGRDAQDYASAIDRLVELNVLPLDFAQRFRAIAGFRNVLVHAYLEVDLDRVLNALQKGLDDVAEFMRYIEAFLANAPHAPQS